MARYVTSIESTLSPEDTFAYMADFSHASQWDPSVVSAARADDGDVGEGSTFDLVVKFAGRTVPMRYEIVSYEQPRLFVVESKKPSFTSRDTITVTGSGDGSVVHYDALLAFKGVGRVFDPIMQLVFSRTGDRAAAGMRAALSR